MINQGQRVRYVGTILSLEGLKGTVIGAVDLECYRVQWDTGNITAHHQSVLEYIGGTTKQTDAVDKPAHYQFFPDLEAIEVIARSMTQEQFYGYCLGNRLKYRLRAGNKDKLEQDIAKSDKYIELYEQHKQKCLDAK